MKKINIDLNGRKINKDELIKLLNCHKTADEKKIENLNFINFDFDSDFFLDESAPHVIIIDYNATLLTLAQIQKAQRKNQLAVGIIGINDQGTIYLQTPTSEEQNVYIVGDDSLEKVIANMLSKSWLHAYFRV